LLVSFAKIHIFFGNKFLSCRGNAVKPATAWELEDVFPGEERSLACHEQVTKAQYDDVNSNVWKIGVFVAASNGIVLEYLPWLHKRTQLCALFSILVPFGRG
jgi:hypothetical protein